VRLGGVVVYGTVEREGPITRFVLTDYKNDMQADYTGTLPARFQEGEGLLAIGTLNTDNIFHATKLLPKKAEIFTPPDLPDFSSSAPSNP
jgi:cytochrome c-type biogenesis protein CcmE